MTKAFITFFNIHRRFRNGVFGLLLIISILCFVLFFLNQNFVSKNELIVLDSYQKELILLKQKAILDKKEYVQKPFNPNFISDYKGYVLGISPLALDRIRAHRAKDRWINSAKEFQVVTGISDSLLLQLAPLFKFPKSIAFKKNSKTSRSAKKTYDQKRDLNKVTALAFEELGIPSFIANRIIAYRKKLGGFLADVQLQDVYGLYPKQSEKVLSLYTVKGKSTASLLDINTATVKELAAIPYFDFEMALAIKDFVKEHGKVLTFYEFDKIEGFPVDKIDRIALYLKI